MQQTKRLVHAHPEGIELAPHVEQVQDRRRLWGDLAGVHAPGAEQPFLRRTRPEQLQLRVAQVAADLPEQVGYLAAGTFEGLEEPALVGHEHAGDAQALVLGPGDGQDVLNRPVEPREHLNHRPAGVHQTKQLAPAVGHARSLSFGERSCPNTVQVRLTAGRLEDFDGLGGLDLQPRPVESLANGPAHPHQPSAQARRL